MTDDEKHAELIERLDTMIKIQSLSAVSHLETKKQKILFLNEAGLAPKDIAPIVGSKSATVSQVIYEASKATKKDK